MADRRSRPGLRPMALWAALGLAAFACDDGPSGTSAARPADATLDATLDGMPDRADVAQDAMPDGSIVTPDAMPDGSVIIQDAMPDAILDGSIAPLDAMPDAAPPDMGPPGCEPGLELGGPAETVPQGSVGHYTEAIDCTPDEGGPWFGDADYTRCFRKSDGSGWRVWNTGCGWVVGGYGPGGDGERHLLTYAGQCDAAPPIHHDTRGLTTGLLFDPFGAYIPDARMTHCPDRTPCAPGVEISGAAEGVPPEITGRYSAARCARDEGGAWFGGVDYSRCFHKDDGSAWRIWNTGCGWVIGRVEGRAGWRRYALTYSGQCASMSPDQREPAALTTGVLYAPDGTVHDGLRADHCRAPSGFAAGVTVLDERGGRPDEMAGAYVEARDCTRDEGGAWFGGVDYTRCFRKADRSAWRIWNTGCGWEIGRPEGPRGANDWQRTARTYTGVCADMPDWQRDVRGLSGFPLVDGFGDAIDGLHLVHTPEPAPCDSTDAIVSLVGDGAPAAIAGRYVEARDCARDEGGAWFGLADFTRCYRKDDGSPWRIWNTGCGWEIGRLDPRDGWDRVARTYTGRCDEMPPLQLDARALTSGVLVDGFGAQIEGLRVDRCADREWAWRY